nr:immunoglobulin heavy chain junction region [Mus musculus]
TVQRRPPAPGVTMLWTT